MSDIELEDYSITKKLINKRIETLKDTLLSVDTLEKLHYIRGQIKSLEDLLQDLKDLQLKQERLNDGELRDFERST